MSPTHVAAPQSTLSSLGGRSSLLIQVGDWSSGLSTRDTSGRVVGWGEGVSLAHLRVPRLLPACSQSPRPLSAFKQSPPTAPALGTNVKKRRHGDDDVYYIHVSPTAAGPRPGHGGARGRPRAPRVAGAVQHALTAETPSSVDPRKENQGYPLLYSCLENPMDRGAWQATVHGITRVGHNLVTKPPTNIS